MQGVKGATASIACAQEFARIVELSQKRMDRASIDGYQAKDRPPEVIRAGGVDENVVEIIEANRNMTWAGAGTCIGHSRQRRPEENGKDRPTTWVGEMSGFAGNVSSRINQ